MNKLINILGDISTLLSVINRKSRQKNPIGNLNTVNQLDLADTEGTLRNNSKFTQKLSPR